MFKGADLGYASHHPPIDERRVRPEALDQTERLVLVATPLKVLQAEIPYVTREVTSGRHLSMEGTEANWIIGVLSGTVRCFRMTTDGRRHISRFAGEGAIIGLCPLGVPPYSAEAVTDAKIALFRVETIETSIRSNATVYGAIMRAIADELSDAARSQMRLSCFSAEERVADFLLTISNAASTSSTSIKMPRADIADHLGITVETVSRAIHRFAKSGLIELINPHEFRIASPSRLKRLVQGENWDHAGSETRVRQQRS